MVCLHLQNPNPCRRAPPTDDVSRAGAPACRPARDALGELNSFTSGTVPSVWSSPVPVLWMRKLRQVKYLAQKAVDVGFRLGHFGSRVSAFLLSLPGSEHKAVLLGGHLAGGSEGAPHSSPEKNETPPAPHDLPPSASKWSLVESGITEKWPQIMGLNKVHQSLQSRR